MMKARGQRDLSGAVEVFRTMWFDGPYRKPGEVSRVVRERMREIVTQSFRLSRLAPNAKGLEPTAIGRLAELLALLGHFKTCKVEKPQAPERFETHSLCHH